MTPSPLGFALTLLAVCFASGCERGSAGAPEGVASTVQALQADTTTALASSNNPSNLGAAVTLTATVSPSSLDAGVPTGTVAFSEGDASLGVGNLDGSGVATFTTSTLGLGQHSLAATYGGDTNFNLSTSTDFVQTVSPDGATLALTSSGNPSVFNGNVTFSAKVSSGVAGSIPTGTVTFREGANTLGTGDLDGAGVALYATSTLSGGSHTIFAAYDGDPNHAAASGSFNQIVDAAPTTTTLKSNTNPSLPGEIVRFTATVLGSGAAPVGSVTFTEGALVLGSTPLVDSGISMFAISTLAPGPHAVTASFGGDLNFRASASSGFVQQVTVTESGPPDTDSAGAAGASGSAGANSNDNAGAGSGGTAGALGSSPQGDGDAGQGGARDSVGASPADPGCGCRSTPRAPASGGALLWVLAALVAVRRSRGKAQQ